MKAWYGQNSQGVADWHLRLCQLIGLPPGTDYDSVTLLWVDPGDLVRPAYDPVRVVLISPLVMSGS